MMSVAPFCSRLLLSAHVRTVDDIGQDDETQRHLYNGACVFRRDGEISGGGGGVIVRACTRGRVEWRAKGGAELKFIR